MNYCEPLSSDDVDLAFRSAELQAPPLSNPSPEAGMPSFCTCRGAVDSEGRCVNCGHRVRVKCDACGTIPGAGAEVELDFRSGLVLIRCERCKTAGRRPTAARVRRVVTIAPLRQELARTK